MVKIKLWDIKCQRQVFILVKYFYSISVLDVHRKGKDILDTQNGTISDYDICLFTLIHTTKNKRTKQHTKLTWSIDKWTNVIAFLLLFR